jgi:hypothetical protein
VLYPGAAGCVHHIAAGAAALPPKKALAPTTKRASAPTRL